MKVRPGFALIPLLLLSMVCMLAALTVAAMSSFFLNAAQVSAGNDKSLALAEGAISMCLSRLHLGLQPGSTATPFGALTSDAVTFMPDPGEPGNIGYLTFNPSIGWGYSTNNMKNNNPSGWGNCSVASGTCHLMARGTYRTSTSIVECTVSIPQFNYALSTDGALAISSGNLSVSAVNSLAGASLTPTPPVGANVGSNTSINVSNGSTYVSGDVVCKTTLVSLGTPATVGGVITQGTVNLPTLNISSVGGPVESAAGGPLASTLTGGTALNGENYAPSGLHVGGDLELDGGLLYVLGSVQIDGSLKGSGAVIAQGPITVNRGTALDCVNELALVSSGNVTLGEQGPPGTSQFFQGLVYSQGLVATNNVTVVGAMVGANPANPGSSGVQLYNTQVVYAPFATNLQLMSLSTADLLSAGAMSIGTVNGGVEAYAPGADINPPPSFPDTTNSTGWVPSLVAPYNGPMTTVTQQVTSALGSDPNLPFLTNDLSWTTLNNPGTVVGPPTTQSGPVSLIAGQPYASASPSPIAAGAPISAPGGGLMSLSATAMNINDLLFPGAGGPGIPDYTIQLTPVMTVPQAQLMVFTNEYDPTTRQIVPLSSPVVFLDGMWNPDSTAINGFNTFLSTYYPGFPGTTYASLVASMTVAQTTFMNAANPLLQSAPTPPANPTLSLSLNSFLADEEPLHIIAWRQLMPGAPVNRNTDD